MVNRRPEAGNSKFQNPNSKQITNSKLQITNKFGLRQSVLRGFELGICDLEFLLIAVAVSRLLQKPFHLPLHPGDSGSSAGSGLEDFLEIGLVDASYGDHRD